MSDRRTDAAVAPPSTTPSLHLTPQLQKQRGGLAPSFWDLSSGTAESSASLSLSVDYKTYRTASSLLHATWGGRRQEEDDETTATSMMQLVRDDATDLKRVVDSIQEVLESLTDERRGTRDVSKLEFEPKGCVWRLALNPHLRASSFEMQVMCSARDAAEESDGGTWYRVDTMLLPSRTKNLSSIASLSSDPGYRTAKEVFDFTALQVRKAVVKCEFPNFPEGCKGRPFREVYQLNARLKSGSFATVCRGTHRATGKKVAIKCVLRKDLPPSDDAAIYDEVAIMASLNHPHIVPLTDFFDEPDCYFIVMELMSGGDLFDRIGKKKTYSEADARDLISKMIQAMEYCHERNIAHCDMKPKNLLLVSNENDSYIKLADFGFAARVHEPKSLTKQCGTPFFVSPEILMKEKYDEMSDMWSVGCIVFLLLGGNLPFLARSQKELFRKIVVGKYEFDSDWVDVSDDAKDLVTRLLVTDPDKRLSAKEALQHKWLLERKERLSAMKLMGTSSRLRTFNARMKLRSAMIAVDWVSSLSRSSGWGGARSSNGNNFTASSGTDTEDRFAKLQFEDDGEDTPGPAKAQRDSIAEENEDEDEDDTEDQEIGRRGNF